MNNEPTKLLSPIQPSANIQGVYTIPIKEYSDERGRFMETFRREWFPWVNWDRLQSNRSDSKAGVLRGLHYHLHQVDYWHVAKGAIRVGLVDLRPSSPTYKRKEIIKVGNMNNVGVFIPVGVAHGFIAQTDCTLIYLVNNYYDGGRDERGVLWNDPEIGLDWGTADPIVSERDLKNPYLKDIPPDALPK